jgi:hypothetical protein
MEWNHMNQLPPGAAPVGLPPQGPDPSLDPLMAALMGGGAPVDPAMGGMDPMMDPMMGGMPPAGPEMGGMPPMGGPQFPTTDPGMVSSLLEQLLMAQQADHQSLQQQQTMALVGNPLFEALVSGAPVGPGAGQDAQAIAPTGMVDPAPAGPLL